MRVGILYDLFDDYPWKEGEPFDAAAENEPPETLRAIVDALRLLGHEPEPIGGARKLVAFLEEGRSRIDVAVNIAEGAHHRGREGEVPTMLAMYGIPFVGSDALTLSLSLDKVWTKDLAMAAGVRAPDGWTVPLGDTWQRVRKEADGGQGEPPFPLFVKPRYEGSAKGIFRDSKVQTLDALTRQVARMHHEYGQDALVETFVEGSEFTVAVVGHAPPRALPVLQRAVDTASGIGLHVLERPGLDTDVDDWALPGALTPELEAALQRDALAIFRKLECRDFARVDFRVDAEGTPWFLEINPLPTFAPDGTFAIMAELMGQTYPEFLASVLDDALQHATKA